MKIQKFGNEKDRSNRSIRNSNMFFEKWREKLDLNLTIEALQKPCLLEALSKGSVGYEMKKRKKLQYLRQLVGVHYCGMKVKEIIIIIIIIIIKSKLNTLGRPEKFMSQNTVVEISSKHCLSSVTLLHLG